VLLTPAFDCVDEFPLVAVHSLSLPSNLPKPRLHYRCRRRQYHCHSNVSVLGARSPGPPLSLTGGASEGQDAAHEDEMQHRVMPQMRRIPINVLRMARVCCVSFASQLGLLDALCIPRTFPSATAQPSRRLSSCRANVADARLFPK
jgi:hypothetical protein